MSVKVSAYIDGANLFHGGEMIGKRIDFQKLKATIETNRTLVDLNFYNSSRNTQAERSFHDKIRSFGYTLKIFRLHQYSGKPQEKKIDTQIVADSLVDGLVDDKFDIAIFGSGDKDILPAVEYLLQRNKQVEIMSFQDTLAWELKTCGVRIINLTRIIKQICIN